MKKRLLLNFTGHGNPKGMQKTILNYMQRISHAFTLKFSKKNTCRSFDVKPFNDIAHCPIGWLFRWIENRTTNICFLPSNRPRLKKSLTIGKSLLLSLSLLLHLFETSQRKAFATSKLYHRNKFRLSALYACDFSVFEVKFGDPNGLSKIYQKGGNKDISQARSSTNWNVIF